MDEATVQERQTLTIEEAAGVLGISARHAYLLAARGEIPALRLGKRWVIVRARLEEMLARGSNAAPYQVPAVEA